MFGLFSRKDELIIQLLAKLEEAKRAAPTEARQVSDPLFDQLAGTIKTKWASEHIANYRNKIQDGESHEAFIYNFIVHATGDKLESGRYHLYRGILSPEGRLYQQLFEHAINTMVSAGGYTKEWADNNLRAPVYKGIKEFG